MISTADHNGDFHAAIKAALAAGEGVYIPKQGCKPCDDTARIEDFRDGRYRQVSLVIQGEARFWDTAAKSVIRFNFSDKPFLSWQIGKGVEIRGLNLQGPKDGNINGLDTRKKLNAAISIDDSDPRERGDNARSGSTGCVVDNCTFNNSAAGIVISVNGYTQNGDNMSFTNIRFQDHKYCFVGCQAQEKNNSFYNVGSWGKVKRFFQFGEHGEGSCGHYVADRIFAAGGVDQILYRNTARWNPMHIKRLFAENIKTIGYWNTKLKDSIKESIINFRPPGHDGFPDNHIYGGGVKFEDCVIRYNSGADALPVLSAAVDNKYIDCDFGLTNPVLGRFNNPKSNPDYNKGYKTTEVAKQIVANVAEKKMQVSGVNTGEIILFTRMGDLAWAGMGKVTEPGVINYISPGINNGEKYDLWRYESS